MTAPTTISVGQGGNGRFTEIDPGDCQTWRNATGINGGCLLYTADVQPGWSNAQQAYYRWVDGEYTTLIPLF